MIKKIVLILAPAERAFFMNLLMPPLAVGVINGYLRESGIAADAYDLNVSLKNKRLNNHREDWLFLYDKEAVMGYLRTGAEKKIEHLFSRLVEDIDFENVDLVGISIGSNFSFFEIHAGCILAKYIKKKYRKPIVFGGDNVQYMYQFRDMFRELWQHISMTVEYIFVGPGERSLVSLIRILNGEITDRSYKDLKGAITFTGSGLIANDQDTPTLCRPDFSSLDLKPYTLCLKKSQPGDKQPNNTFFFKWPFAHALMLSDLNRSKLKEQEQEETLFIPYKFNANCPFKCAFCTQSSETKKRVICKAAETVVDDMEALMNQYKSGNFFFFNNVFNVNRAFVKNFCRIVKERGLQFSWSDCGRFNDLDKELLQMMVEAGCRKLVFGLDSGSPKILKLIDKRLDLDHARKVLGWCKDVGIWPEIEVILGFPYELEGEFKETYDFVKDNLDVLNGFYINKYFVVPVSLMGWYPERYGMRLVKLRQKYENKLENNARLFLKAVDAQDDKVSAANFHIYHFEETRGRGFKQIIKETQDKVMRLYKLYPNMETFEETRLNLMLYKLNKHKAAKSRPIGDRKNE
jgi:radical SAM superfamily enzyme YgiQ (UPF0313 family)